MSNILIDGYESIPARTYNQALAIAQYIANKDRVYPVIVCAHGVYENEIISPR